MKLATIKKEVDEFFLLNADNEYSLKIKEKIGEAYTSVGVDLNLVQLLKEIIYDSLEDIGEKDFISLIRDLVTNHIFEKVLLGYYLLICLMKTSILLKQSEILEFRPRTLGLFNHLFATHILPFYIWAGIVNQQVFTQFANSKNISDQLILLRAFAVISRDTDTEKWRDVTKLMFKNKNWVTNN